MLLKAGALLDAVNNAKQKPIDVAKLNKEVGGRAGAVVTYTDARSTSMLAGWHAWCACCLHADAGTHSSAASWGVCLSDAQASCILNAAPQLQAAQHRSIVSTQIIGCRYILMK
jgi:hypothetical protein